MRWTTRPFFLCGDRRFVVMQDSNACRAQDDPVLRSKIDANVHLTTFLCLSSSRFERFVHAFSDVKEEGTRPCHAFHHFRRNEDTSLSLGTSLRNEKTFRTSIFEDSASESFSNERISPFLFVRSEASSLFRAPTHPSSVLFFFFW